MDLGWKVLIPGALGWLMLLIALRVAGDAGWDALGVFATGAGSVVVLLACWGLLALAFRASRRTRELEGVID
jgi:hypothetical protein